MGWRHVVRAVGWVLWYAFLVGWLIAVLFVVFTVHAAYSGYWGSEWEVSTGQAVAVVVVWLLGGVAIVASARALRRPIRVSDRRPAPPEVRRRAWLVLAVTAVVLLALTTAASV